MGRLPNIGPRISATSLRTTGGFSTRSATAEDFGAAGGRALAAAGQGLTAISAGLDAEAERRRREDVANRVAQSDFTREELQLRQEVGPDADGYQERVLERYDSWVDEQVQGVEDDQTRTELRERLIAQRPTLSSRSAQYEFSTAASNSSVQANASIAALDNKIRVDPTGYDEYVQQGADVIDARPGLTQATKAEMVANWRNNAALARFEGLLDGAGSVEDLNAIERQLTNDEGSDRDWTAELSTRGLDSLLGRVRSAKTAIRTKADADARAAITSLQERAGDGTVLIDPRELQAVQSVVSQSQNPVTLERMARIQRDQAILREVNRLPPAEQRRRIVSPAQASRLPARVNSGINRATQLFNVSASYLASTVEREYGQQLAGPEDQIDYGLGNAAGASSAVGVGQFVRGTWLRLMRDPAVTSRMSPVLQEKGINLAGMSDEELLALRSDPELSILGTAAYAEQNQRQAEGILGRQLTDAELYMGHFLGGAGAATLFRAILDNPDQNAAELFPAAANANPTVFGDRSARQLYDELARRHGTSESGVAFGDRQTRQRIADTTENRVADDPIDFVGRQGIFNVGDIDTPDGIAARGELARSVSDYYSIPNDQMKPFTKAEADQLSRRMQDGTVQDVLDIVSSVQGMGGDMARAGLRQLGEENQVFGFAGGLAMSTGSDGVASQIIRGQKRLDENPDIRQQIGGSPEDISAAFNAAVNGALVEVAPRQRQAIQDAALAHYVETAAARGKAGAFSSREFEASVNAVLGGSTENPAVHNVNGEQVVLPRGLDADTVEDAFNRMSVADFGAISKNGLPPRYATGAEVQPEDIADEGVLRAIGANEYKIEMSDGSYLVTGRANDRGSLEAYVAVLDTTQMREFAARRSAPAQTAEAVVDPTMPPVSADPVGDDLRADVERLEADGLTHEEYRALVSKYGATAIEEFAGNR